MSIKDLLLVVFPHCSYLFSLFISAGNMMIAVLGPLLLVRKIFLIVGRVRNHEHLLYLLPESLERKLKHLCLPWRSLMEKLC